MTKLKFKNDIVNFLKTKANLESSQRKITYTEKKHFQTVDFLSETMEVRRQWNILFKGLKEKNTGNKIILHLARVSFKNDEVNSKPCKSTLLCREKG